MAEFDLQEPLDKEDLIKNYKDLNFVEVADELQCKRCSRVLIHNYRANCGHYFCRNCKNFLTNGTGWKCPSCDVAIETIETNSWEIENKVLDLQVHCINCKYGCEEITSLKDLKAHHDICQVTKELNLPVLIRGPEKISKVMDKIGELSTAIIDLKDVVLSSKAETDKRLGRESKRRNLHENNFEAKFSNLEHKVNGIGSQLTETIQTFKQSTNVQLQAEINELSFQHNDIKKLLNELKNQQNAFQFHIATTLEKAISDLTKNIRPIKAINILLMGESGSGKSTLINSFANYCKYTTFDESINHRDKCMINTKITVTNDDYEEIELTTGVSDSNECAELNQSSTMACRSYLFPINDTLQIRLIDTAGFASTMGPKYDDDSVEDIISYLSQYDELHAVAIVMKGNETRITSKFSYCIQQILTFFHKSVIPNIIFIFTRTTKVADSLQTIKAAFKEIEEQSSTLFAIKVSKKIIFCFENKGFNDVIAIRNKIAIGESEIEESIRNWNLAKTEFERFISQVIKLEPFHVSETMRLNEVRVLVRDLNAVLNHLRETVEQQNPAINDNKSDLKLREELKIEQLMLEEAIAKCWKFIYVNSVLYFNFAKQEYVKDAIKAPDVAAVETDKSFGENFGFEVINNYSSEGNKFYVSYSELQKLKKDLVLMNVYGSKLAYLFQLNSKTNKNVIKEKVVQI